MSNLRVKVAVTPVLELSKDFNSRGLPELKHPLEEVQPHETVLGSKAATKPQEI